MTTFIAGLIVGVVATMVVLCVSGVIYIESDEGKDDDD